MSLISSKIFPAARCISPRVLMPRCGFRRNYWRRRDSFSELSTAVQSMENYMKELDRQMNRVFEDFQRMSPVKIPRLLSTLDIGKVRDIPVVSNEGDGRLYKLELDMQDMKPEDIHITLRNNELTITARREEKRDDGSRFVRENAYHYTLPEEINPDTVRSSLTNGVLAIEAQLPALESKEIPVNIEKGNKPTGADSSDPKK